MDQFEACKDFITYDVSEWPLVKCVVHPIDPSPEVFDAHLQCFRALLHRDEKFTLMFDLSNACIVSMSHMKVQAQFMEDMKPKIVENLVASAIVSGSMLVRGLITMLFNIKKPSRPNKTFDGQEKARAWLKAQWPSKFFFE